MATTFEGDGGLEALAKLVAQATQSLPALIQRRDKLQAELAQINQKVNALMQYISAFTKPGAPPVTIPLPGGGHMQIGPGGVVHQTPAPNPAAGVHVVGGGGIPAHILAALGQQMTSSMLGQPVTAQTQPQTTPTGRAPKGMVYRHVDAVMAGGGKYTLKSLRDEVKKRFVLEYGSSSIHRAISAGVNEKRYKLEGNLYSKA